MSQLEVKNIIISDLKEIERIGSLCLPLYYEVLDLMLFLMDKNHFCLKVIDPKKPKNIMGYLIAEYQDQKTRIHIKSLGTLPEYRRQGVAKLMITYLKFQQKVNSDLHTLSLYVLEDNWDAIKFYARQNFSAKKKLPNYYQTLNKDGYYLVCDLPSEG